MVIYLATLTYKKTIYVPLSMPSDAPSQAYGNVVLLQVEENDGHRQGMATPEMSYCHLETLTYLFGLDTRHLRFGYKSLKEETICLE